MLSSIGGIKDLALTTNGMTLAKEAQALHDAGLRRVSRSAWIPSIRSDFGKLGRVGMG